MQGWSASLKRETKIMRKHAQYFLQLRNTQLLNTLNAYSGTPLLQIPLGTNILSLIVRCP